MLKTRGNIDTLVMQHSRNILIFNIPRTLFGNIFRNFIGFFFNISVIYHGNLPRIFHEHIFARWIVAFLRDNGK